LTDYALELARSESRDYFRPNFFANTPDILPPILQTGGPGAFRIRFALAALLSGVYGIYNGFELCEGTGIPGTEEYLDSEKYQYKAWDWDRPGNIKPFISEINRIRRENSALQDWTNIDFHDSDNEQVLFFSKSARDLSHFIFIILTLDPKESVSATLTAPADLEGIDLTEAPLDDLLTGESCTFGDGLDIELTPDRPLRLLRYRPV
jgi:starch synthase (maltosyl-transferring)